MSATTSQRIGALAMALMDHLDAHQADDNPTSIALVVEFDGHDDTEPGPLVMYDGAHMPELVHRGAGIRLAHEDPETGRATFRTNFANLTLVPTDA
jgi:hypothetical protein